MPLEIIWLPRAQEELSDILVDIGLHNEDAAWRIFRRLVDRVERLAEFPKLGRRRTDIAPSARMLVEGRYLVLYRLDNEDDPGRIEVVSIVDGRRDLPTLF